MDNRKPYYGGTGRMLEDAKVPHQIPQQERLC